LTDALQNIVVGFGFDSYTYAYATQLYPNRETRSYVWTTAPAKWVDLYDQRAFIEIDPRLTKTAASAVPIVWDRSEFPDSPDARSFFDAAAQFGICSGIATMVRDPSLPRVLFSFNSSAERLSQSHLAQLTEQLGDIMALADWVHAVFMSDPAITAAGPPTFGRPLSQREQQCLRLAAKGQTSAQIGRSLGISERTVHSHFENILAKLDAANRHEAIARAAVQGFLDNI
jgi:DNA-binding CsgD family transcriptional regulator